jgi:hypothetical protein
VLIFSTSKPACKLLLPMTTIICSNTDISGHILSSDTFVLEVVIVVRGNTTLGKIFFLMYV